MDRCPKIYFNCIALWLSIFLLLSGTTFAMGTDWEFLLERTNDVQAKLADGVIDIKTTGTDPFLIGKIKDLDAGDCVLEFEYICASGINDLQVFFGPPFGLKSSCILPRCLPSDKWQVYSGEIVNDALVALSRKPSQMRIDFGRVAGVQIQIRNLHLRPASAAELAVRVERDEKRKVKLSESNRISEYLTDSFPVNIDSVHVKADEILLTGSGIPGRVALADLRLVEYPAWHSIGKEDSGFELNVALKAKGKKWQATLPRLKSGRDRLHSGWRLQYQKGETKKYVTARRFATRIDTTTKNFSRRPLLPANQKGMGGIQSNGPLEELVELGVTAITVNILLSPFVSERNDPKFRRIAAPGKPIYFNPGAFRRHDAVIDWARKNDIVVTAILLVPVPQNAKRTQLLVHPENKGGKYAMPDLATDRGAIVYAKVLDELARRYSNSEESPGAITNWIAHNEIDQHAVWTNMGDQPREIVTETYYRSMRMIHNAARQHNPHARVFTSTTHHWFHADDNHWDKFAAGEFYVALQRYSRSEGDFGWGVGHHPYPSNLRAATAWNDKGVTNDVKTPKITMQNIEVLGRFLELPFMADAEGNSRPILLCEQGFNSVTYNEQDQANQAGSLAYAMKKVQAMPIVESFHYHRWIDHPGEGGVNFGLRTLPSETEKFGDKKLSWEVYQAIGTPRERKVTRGLPGP